MITQYDIEYLLIFVILGILFLKGLKPNIGGQFRPFVIDKTMSQALKGMANYCYNSIGLVYVFLWLWYVFKAY